MIECPPSTHEAWGFDSLHHIKLGMMYTYDLAPERWRQEDKMFKVISNYIASPKPVLYLGL